MRHMDAVSSKVQKCIDYCRSCHQLCVETMYYCLSKGNEHSNPRHIGILLDCAQMCETTADFMSRNSEYYKVMCNICADICRTTADDCSTMKPKDDKMQDCAKECIKCMDSCQKIAKT